MTPSTPRFRLPDRAVPWLAPGAVVAFYGVMAWRHRWLHEDGLINLRVVENLFAGRGLGYNAGERVEAFTSPAQIALVALGRVLTFGQVPLAQEVLIVGVLASVTGLLLVVRGSMHLWGADEPGRTAIPLGVLVFAAVPLTWDFATSGHEGSVGFLWIGMCWFGLARRQRDRSLDLAQPVDRPRWLLMAIGSGALVRPEFSLFTVSFVVWWFWCNRGASGSRIRAAAWMFGPVVAYQIFRMGYYGLLVPNTALAKLGGPLGTSAGLYYVGAFVSPFELWLPLLLLACALGFLVADASRGQAVLVAALMVPAVANVAYLISIGGDYVNGRLLVVPFLALVAPVAVVPRSFLRWPNGRVALPRVAGIAIVALWAIVCAAVLRPPWQITSKTFLDPRYDAREVAIRKWVGHPPRSISDYGNSFLAGPYRALIKQYGPAGGDVLVVDDPFLGQAVLLPRGSGPVIASTTIGALGVVSGTDVRIVDRLALADPVASHLPVSGTTAGHLRELTVPWVYARVGVVADRPSAEAARAMRCGALHRVLVDTTGRLTVGRFLTNLVDAPANTTLHVPLDPDEAVRAFC